MGKQVEAVILPAYHAKMQNMHAFTSGNAVNAPSTQVSADAHYGRYTYDEATIHPTPDYNVSQNTGTGYGAGATYCQQYNRFQNDEYQTIVDDGKYQMNNETETDDCHVPEYGEHVEHVDYMNYDAPGTNSPSTCAHDEAPQDGVHCM